MMIRQRSGLFLVLLSFFFYTGNLEAQTSETIVTEGDWFSVSFSNATPDVMYLLDKYGKVKQYDSRNQVLADCEALNSLGMRIEMLAWSPSGSRVAFRSNGDLYAFDFSTRDIRRLTQSGKVAPSEIVWRNENEVLYTESLTKASMAIRLMNVKTREVRTIITPEETYSGQHPPADLRLQGYLPETRQLFMSEYDSRIAYPRFLVGELTEDDELRDIRQYIRDAWVSEGSQAPVPGGRLAVFSGVPDFSDQETGIYLVDVASGQVLKTLSKNRRNTEIFTVSPNGKVLALTRMGANRTNKDMTRTEV